MTLRTTRRGVLRTVGTGAFGAAVVGSVPVVGKPGVGELETLFTYDPSMGELPENVSVDRRGAKYVSFPPLGQIRRITPDNESESVLAEFDIGSGNGVIGVEVDPTRTLYACLVTFGTGDAHGIWRVEPDGSKSLFAGLPPGTPATPETFPNDILLDGHSLLVTDTIGGAVYRVSEGEAAVWAADPLLEGTGAFGFGFPLGANGIARTKDGSVVVTNPEKAQLVRIPTTPDGSAGTPESFVEDQRLFASDGLAIDTRDHLYVGIIGQDTVVRVAPDGTIETLATAEDGLDGPSDVTFGTTRGEQKDLFVTNFALLNAVDPAPSLMKFDVGVPGAPIRR